MLKKKAKFAPKRDASFVQGMNKIAESLDNLANAIAKDAMREEAQVKTASRRSALDYGHLDDAVNPQGMDSFTQFLLS